MLDDAVLGEGGWRWRRWQRETGLQPAGQPHQPVVSIRLQSIHGGSSYRRHPRHGVRGPGGQGRLPVPRHGRWLGISDVLHLHCRRHRQRRRCQRWSSAVQSIVLTFTISVGVTALVAVLAVVFARRTRMLSYHRDERALRLRTQTQLQTADKLWRLATDRQTDRQTDIWSAEITLHIFPPPEIDPTRIGSEVWVGAIFYRASAYWRAILI